ncbi:cache domain-containing protein, partial [Marinitoga sp. 1155]|uniref:cache domain-containing protein n=1 Tax=Marinitoga sp. 1155 TaxID=1428448 RepID=UPI0006414FD9
MRLQGKILLLFVVIVSLVLVVFFTISISNSQNSLKNSFLEKLIVAKNLKMDFIDTLLKEAESDLTYIKNFEKIKDAFFTSSNLMEDFQSSMNMNTILTTLRKIYIENNPYKDKSQLYDYYYDENFKKENFEDNIMSIFYDYSVLHSELQMDFREFIHIKGYEDMLLISPKGMVVYSVSKYDDFATDLNNENTILSRLYKLLKEKNDNNVHFSEIGKYLGGIGFFAGVKVEDEDFGLYGYLIFRIPISKIDKLLQDKSGMGETGKTYIVSEDKIMRNNLPGEETILKQKVETDYVEKALSGETGWEIGKNYKGEKVIVAYAPFKYKEIKWAFISEVSTKEAFSASEKIKIVLIITSIIILIISIIISIIFARKISKPLMELSKKVDRFATGDFTVEFKSKGKDETAIIAKSLQNMSNNLRETVKWLLKAGNKIEESSEILGEVAERTMLANEEAQEKARTIEENAENAATTTEELTS